MNHRIRDHIKALEIVLINETREWVLKAVEEEIRQLKRCVK